MTRTVTPPTARIPIGTLTINGQKFNVDQHPEFTRWFNDLQDRIGGVEALSNIELASITSGLQFGVFSVRQAPADSLSIPQCAAFMPRRQEQSAPLADASAVLCSRVFAKR